jgi:Uncharacterized ACR, COG1993
LRGFGFGRRIHIESFPDISADLPLIAEAIDTRERIEPALPTFTGSGLVTIEHSLLAVGDDARRAEFPGGGRSAGRLTVSSPSAPRWPCGRRMRATRRSRRRASVPRWSRECLPDVKPAATANPGAIESHRFRSSGSTAPTLPSWMLSTIQVENVM